MGMWYWKNHLGRAGRWLAQWIKALAAMSKNLSSSQGQNSGKIEPTLPSWPLTPTSILMRMRAHIHYTNKHLGMTTETLIFFLPSQLCLPTLSSTVSAVNSARLCGWPLSDFCLCATFPSHTFFNPLWIHHRGETICRDFQAKWVHFVWSLEREGGFFYPEIRAFGG